MKKFTVDKPQQESLYFEGVYVRENLVALTNGQIVNTTNRGSQGQEGKFKLDKSQGFPTAVLVSLTETEEPDYSRGVAGANTNALKEHIETKQGFEYNNVTTHETPNGVLTIFTLDDHDGNQITDDFTPRSLCLYLKKSGATCERLIYTTDFTQLGHQFEMVSYTPQVGDVFTADVRVIKDVSGGLNYEDFNGES